MSSGAGLNLKKGWNINDAAVYKWRNCYILLNLKKGWNKSSPTIKSKSLGGLNLKKGWNLPPRWQRDLPRDIVESQEGLKPNREGGGGERNGDDGLNLKKGWNTTLETL